MTDLFHAFNDLLTRWCGDRAPFAAGIIAAVAFVVMTDLCEGLCEYCRRRKTLRRGY